jgi:hypothetical protein
MFYYDYFWVWILYCGFFGSLLLVLIFAVPYDIPGQQHKATSPLDPL